MPIKTVGDLVRLSKSDCLKIRHFGSRCLTEADDMIDAMGLHWKMDVDAIFRERIALLMEKNRHDIRDGKEQ